MTDWAAMKAERQAEGVERRAQAAEHDFAEAARIASGAGLTLRRCTDAHYQLQPVAKTGRWLINLYPGNGRIYADRQRPRAPFLKVPKPWSLLDVVRAAAATTRR